MDWPVLDIQIFNGTISRIFDHNEVVRSFMQLETVVHMLRRVRTLPVRR